MPVIITQGYTCEPSSLMESTPCLSCLPPNTLLALLVAIVGYAAGKTVDEVVTDAACFQCLNEQQKLRALVTKFGNDLLGTRYTAQEVIDAMHCLTCKSEAELKAMLVQLLCNEVTLTIAQET